MGTDRACEAASYARPEVFAPDGWSVGEEARLDPDEERQVADKDCLQRLSSRLQWPSRSVRSSERVVKPRKWKICQEVPKKKGPRR